MNPPSEVWGTPASALERLKANKERIERGAFTSSLSVSEFLLAKASGYESLGQVMGASVYQIGGQFRNPNWSDSARRKAREAGYSMELTTQTAAHAEARDKAMSRLAAEAAALGAEGVVGVLLRVEMPQHNEISSTTNRVIEFQAIGTAVKSAAFRQGTPFLSNLSGAELWQLQTAGYEPCGFAFGNCSYFQSLPWKTQQRISPILGRGWQNSEIEEYTRLFYTARELATERMAAQARTNGAQGIIGVSVELTEISHEATANNSNAANYGHIALSFQAYGTAVRPTSRRNAADTSLGALPVLSLNA